MIYRRSSIGTIIFFNGDTVALTTASYFDRFHNHTALKTVICVDYWYECEYHDEKNDTDSTGLIVGIVM
ncbi:hypothetical protein M758_UG118800 [Ceratodon purpureus]|nr:hypothetical protein M758_UG118800 [Ceratodon purpureus]